MEFSMLLSWWKDATGKCFCNVCNTMTVIKTLKICSICTVYGLWSVSLPDSKLTAVFWRRHVYFARAFEHFRTQVSGSAVIGWKTIGGRFHSWIMLKSNDVDNNTLDGCKLGKYIFFVYSRFVVIVLMFFIVLWCLRQTPKIFILETIMLKITTDRLYLFFLSRCIST